MALCLSLLSAAAQETLEQRYQRATELFNSGDPVKTEEGCELFQQIQQEKPGFKDTAMYVTACQTAVRQIYAREEKLFNEGVNLFNEGQYEEARQKFQQAKGMRLKKSRYREQIEKHLADIETRQREERLLQEGIKLLNEGKEADARARLNEVVQMGGPKAAEARSQLEKLDKQKADQAQQEQREESAFNEAERLYRSGDLSAARRGFQDVVGMNGKRRAQAEQYLREIEQALREETVFQEAVRKFEQKDYDGARTAFQQVVALNRSRKAEAESYLQRIQAAQREETLFREAEQKFQRKDYEGAKAGFQQVAALNGARKAEADSYLRRIESVLKVQTAGGDPKEVAKQFVADAQAAIGRKNYADALEKLRVAESLDPTNRDVRRLLAQVEELAAEQSLRDGLRAYFEGKYDDAERLLTAYVKNNGRKSALAYFFRGAAHCARYFLAGERDTDQKQLALADFRATQKDTRRFRPPEKFVPAKILALYSEAVGVAAR